MDTFQLIRPSRLCQTLYQDRFTGKVLVQNPDDEFVAWELYWGNGKIHYAGSTVGKRERCRYVLQKNALNFSPILPANLQEEHDYFYQLTKQKVLTFEQCREILDRLTQEALVHVLALPDSRCYLTHQGDFSTPILNLSVDTLKGKLRHRIRCWQALKPLINSPFQRPLVQDWEAIAGRLKGSGDYRDSWLAQLHQSLKHLHCLYDIAYQTQVSTLEIAVLFRRLMESGLVSMLPYQDIPLEEGLRIAYIDEQPAHQRMVNYILQKKAYRVTSIPDPCQALVTLQNQRVDLVLINAVMDGIDGFQLTQLCRQTPALATVPIVLLLDSKNILHTLRAKVAGASGYLHKPFLPQELMAEVERWLPASAKV